MTDKVFHDFSMSEFEFNDFPRCVETLSKQDHLIENVWSYIYCKCKVSPTVIIYEIFASEMCMNLIWCDP